MHIDPVEVMAQNQGFWPWHVAAVVLILAVVVYSASTLVMTLQSTCRD